MTGWPWRSSSPLFDATAPKKTTAPHFFSIFLVNHLGEIFLNILISKNAKKIRPDHQIFKLAFWLFDSNQLCFKSKAKNFEKS